MSTTAVEQQAQLDLRPFAVTRGAEGPKKPEALTLSRAWLKLTIFLPVGSEPGVYEFQILDVDLKPRTSSTGSATIVDYVTTLETSLDTSALPPGNYQLVVRRLGGRLAAGPSAVTVGASLAARTAVLPERPLSVALPTRA